VRRLQKRFPHIKDDVRVAIQALLQEPRLGVVIPGGSGIRKLRVRSSDMQRGKSGSFRLLYLLNERSELVIYLVLIYPKSERDDITRKELQDLLREIESDLD
jgi:mRNA-degrading endonuclease RelE of RelBE toxin-antitoxin system